MKHLAAVCSFLCLSPLAVVCQQKEPAPIYKVTVEQRTIKAVNYGHRSDPTQIDFRGTPILATAKGEATVTPRTGSVEVDAKFEGLVPPTRFGPAYLTYVLWAITPDGRPTNLGEVVADASNKARIKVTSRFQAFGLLVTAEPYFAVTHPSNLVVLENSVRPGTTGTVEQVDAKYELFPRGEYPNGPKTLEMQGGSQSNANAKKVPIDQYEAVLALYQAQNALQIAKAEGADQFANDTLQKAQQLYDQANGMKDSKGESKKVVTLAREAAQTAEDARTIAMSHKQKPQTAGQ